MIQPLHLTSDFAKVEIPAACRPRELEALTHDWLEKFTGASGLIKGEVVAYVRRIPAHDDEPQTFQVLRVFDGQLEHRRLVATYQSALHHVMACAYMLEADLI